MSADQVAFAEARLTEDEAKAEEAQRAAKPPWLAANSLFLIQDAEGVYDIEVAAVSDYRYDAVLVHAARHDPARALRDVEAGRRILARYQDCLARMEDPDYPQGVARDQAREYEDFVLPNLLVRWAGHPDYDQEWKP